MTKDFTAFKEVLKDEVLKRELEAYLTEKKPEDKDGFAKAAIEFASSKGFAVTPEELNKIRELSFEELEEISGGGWIWDVGSSIGCWIEDTYR